MSESGHLIRRSPIYRHVAARPLGRRSVALLAALALAGCTNNGGRDKTLSALAVKIHASDGKLLMTEPSGGGLDGPRSLGILTLRDGTDAQVSAQAIGDVATAGYVTRGNTGPCTTRTKSCLFTAEGQPSVSFESYPAGELVRGTHVTVPAGQTGLYITLTASN